MAARTQLVEEAEFFDRWALENAQELEPVEEAILQRYRHPGKLYQKEYCFGLLGDVRGRTILDVGCGGGEDAMILARLGAQVTGLDVSPGAIELAKQRAAVNGVSNRTRFLCAPLGGSLPESSFDVIWIDNVLHHVLGELENVMRSLLRAAKPGATIICIEPVNLNKALRKIRFLVPVHTEVTPGERPLEKQDLAVLEALVPDLSRTHFNFLGRLNRFVIPGFRYERASPWRRALCDALHLFDRAILTVPGLANLGGIGVLHGRRAAG
jgi:SAM-dependent methyltransferase